MEVGRRMLVNEEQLGGQMMGSSGYSGGAQLLSQLRALMMRPTPGFFSVPRFIIILMNSRKTDVLNAQVTRLSFYLRCSNTFTFKLLHC